MARFVRILQDSSAIGVSVLTILTLAIPARGSPLVLNGSFESVGAATSSFSINNPTVLPSWGSTPSGNQILDCLVFPSDITNLCGPTVFGGGLTFWASPGASPDGGNFLAVDGDPNFATPITQTLNGLEVGAQYGVTFYQAATQQNSLGFNGSTTEVWLVSLGTESHSSSQMNNGGHGVVGWMGEALTFTATSTSEVLSFVSVGARLQGSFGLLDGVSVTQVPEAVTSGLVGIGLLAISLACRLANRESTGQFEDG